LNNPFSKNQLLPLDFFDLLAILNHSTPLYFDLNRGRYFIDRLYHSERRLYVFQVRSGPGRIGVCEGPLFFLNEGEIIHGAIPFCEGRDKAGGRYC
jgi:hypothetical protein